MGVKLLWSDMVFPRRPLAWAIMQNAAERGVPSLALSWPWPRPGNLGGLTLVDDGSGACSIGEAGLISWLQKIRPIGWDQARAEIAGYQSALRMALDEGPTVVFAWHQFNPFHWLLSQECRARGVQVYWLEHGLLPGTIGVDTQGQMGHSDFAALGSNFRNLPVSSAALASVRKYLDWSIGNKISRNPQQASDLTLPSNRLESKVLFLGSNDPRTEHAWDELMSGDALWPASPGLLETLIEVANPLGFGVDARPHPMHNKGNYPDFSGVPGSSRLSWLEPDESIWDTIAGYDVIVTNYSQSQIIAILQGKRPIVFGPRITPWDHTLQVQSPQDLVRALLAPSRFFALDMAQVEVDIAITLEQFGFLLPDAGNPATGRSLDDFLDQVLGSEHYD